MSTIETKPDNGTTTYRGHDEEAFETVMAATMQRIVLGDNLAALQPDEKMDYYSGVCRSLRLNPLTKPFQYLELKADGGGTKLVLYATKSCTDQLRMKYGITVNIVDKRTESGLYIVTAQAKTPDGRCDEDCGAVAIEKEDGQWKTAQGGKRFFEGNGKIKPLAGDALANAMMKCVTKAKRRVTLSICGLGMLDESEIDTIVGARKVPEDGDNGDKQPDPTNGVNTSGTSTAPPAQSAASQSQTRPIDTAWLDIYERAVAAAHDEQSLELAEFNARGQFDKLSGVEKEQLKERLIGVKAAKDAKRASFRSSPDLPPNADQTAVKQNIVDDLIDTYGLEMFQADAVALGCKGSLDGWSLEQLNQIGQRLKGIPF